MSQPPLATRHNLTADEAFVRRHQSRPLPTALLPPNLGSSAGQAKSTAHHSLVPALNDHLRKSPAEHQRELVMNGMGKP